MKILERQRGRLDRVTQLIATVGFMGLVGIALMTTADAGLRWGSLPRIPGFRDYSEVIFAVVIASCFPAGLMGGHNVTVRFLGSALGQRSNAVLETFGSLMTLLFFTLLFWQFIELTLDLQKNHRVTTTIGLPVAPWWWITTAVISVCVPVQLWVVLDRINSVVLNRPVQTEPPPRDEGGA